MVFKLKIELSSQMDAYALGATVWTMIFKINPTGRNIIQDAQSKTLPKVYRSLLKNLLAEDPDDRMSVHRVLYKVARGDKLFRGMIERL